MTAWVFLKNPWWRVRQAEWARSMRLAASSSSIAPLHPGRAPGWFGPAIDTLGDNRSDPPHPRRNDEPGVCYVAEQLGGVTHDGVLRGRRQPALSRRKLSDHHAITDTQVTLVGDRCFRYAQGQKKDGQGRLYLQ